MTGRALVVTWTIVLTSCGVPERGDTLAGRSRPLLDHDWALPGDLGLAPSSFEAPDAVAALHTAPNGLRAYILSDTADPIVQVTAALPLGRALERGGETAASEVLARQLAGRVRRDLRGDGPSRVQTGQEVDFARITVTVPAEDWRRALGAVVAALRDPGLDPTVVAAFRTGSGYASPTTGLGSTAFRPAVELERLVAGYPVAPPDPGLRVSPEAVHRIARRALHPGAAVLGVGGGVAREAVERALVELTAGWAPVAPLEPPERQLFPDPRLPQEPVLAIDQDGATSWLAIGHPLPPVDDAAEPSLAVLEEVLNIRINIATREIRGLTNRALLRLPRSADGSGLLHVRTGSRPESVAPLVHYIMEELSRIRRPGGSPTEDEMEQAKGGLVTSAWQASLDGARQASLTYAVETVRYGSLEHLQRWPKAVRAVTAEQVRAAAERYILPDRMTAVLIGPLDAIRAARHPRWPFSLEEVSPELRRPVTGGD